MIALSCTRRGSGWILGNISSQKEVQAAQQVVGSLPMGMFKKRVRVALEATVSEHGGDGSAVGHDDPSGLSQS